MNAAMVPIFTEDMMQWIEFNKLCYEHNLNVTNAAFQLWILNVKQITQIQNELHDQIKQR